MKLKFFFFQETLAIGAFCKIQSQGWKECGLHNTLSIMKDCSSMDYTLVLANASRGYETFGNKKVLTSDPKAVERALPFSG